MELSPSLKADSPLANLQILRLLRKPKVHLYVHKVCHRTLSLAKLSPFHNLTSYFYFNSLLSYHPRLRIRNFVFPSGFRIKFFFRISHLLHGC